MNTGHYIPELANELIDTPIDGLNFTGYMMGNPYVDNGTKKEKRKKKKEKRKKKKTKNRSSHDSFQLLMRDLFLMNFL